MPSALQPWVQDLTIMQQSVLLASIRAPDGIHKNHPVKVLMRWYRRCVLVSAFDRKTLDNPFELGGGSFTGPFTSDHLQEFCPGFRNFSLQSSTFSGMISNLEDAWVAFNHMRKVYLNSVDELPHHFQLHFMHSAEIIGYQHPNEFIRNWWREFYYMIVNDAHLFPESKDLMNLRLSDSPDEWRKREEVTAK